MSRLQSCSRLFEKSLAVAENKIPENRTFSDESEEMHIHEAICISMTATLRASVLSVAESTIAEGWQVGK
jgi:hypothetical protein